MRVSVCVKPAISLKEAAIRGRGHSTLQSGEQTTVSAGGQGGDICLTGNGETFTKPGNSKARQHKMDLLDYINIPGLCVTKGSRNKANSNDEAGEIFAT